VDDEIDLKLAARETGNKRIEMLAVKELLPTTGYIRGGCSPIGMKKKFPTFLDESALLHDRITVSAGVRGAQLFLAVKDLLPFVEAKCVPLTVK
jgi:Cys-tRNA(Pro)/Cys-tRNA(Cys) deacylase